MYECDLLGAVCLLRKRIFSDMNEKTLRENNFNVAWGIVSFFIFIPRIRVESTIKIDLFTLPVYFVENS